MTFGMQDFEGLSVRTLLDSFDAIPSVVQRLEQEIGARMRRTNIHLGTFVEDTGKALDWLTSVSVKVFAPSTTVVWRMNPGREELSVVACRQAKDAIPSLPQWEVRETVSRLVRNRSGMRFDPLSTGRLTAMAIPMMVGEHLIGAVHLEGPTEYGDEDFGTLSFLVDVFTLSCLLTTLTHPAAGTLGGFVDVGRTA